MIDFFNNLAPEITECILWVVSIIGMLFFMQKFGLHGLYMYMCLAVVIANIQVIKCVKFGFFDSPIALGTTLFSTTFLCSDIITEYFGLKEAKRGIYLSLASMILCSIWLFLTIGIKPVSSGVSEIQSIGLGISEEISAQKAMLRIFQMNPSLTIASLISYFASQLYDVWIFNWMKKFSRGSFVLARNFLAMAFSAFVDTCLFSFLAWVVFNPNIIPIKTIWKTYIIGVYFMRLFFVLINCPIIILAKKIHLFQKS